MADRMDEDRMSDERFGRRNHEGMNGGVSRNAHVSGGGAVQGSSSEQGRGGYGDDTGFTSGTQGAGAADDSITSEEQTEETSRTDGAGREAPSGMRTDEFGGSAR